MPVDDQPGPESPGTCHGHLPPPAPPAEALRQIARDMVKAYEVALEVDPQLSFGGRIPMVAGAQPTGDRA
ncbi:hypothetical protein [Micromonospora sp. NPDC051141]|uniref:hypothetical protein n=1 Tax=Micromonospora sp. NPDC051141 TaxID=3364284 RepID=UPI003794ECBE